MNFKRLLSKLFLALLGLLAALALTEAILRRTKWEIWVNLKAFVEYDSVRGWRNVPNVSNWCLTREYRTHVQHNSRGIRGPERPYVKSANVQRIILLGDSFVHGYSVDLHEHTSEVLEAMLNARPSSGRFEVIAMGTAAYSTDQELLWLMSEGWNYQPDFVILMFYENDVLYNNRTSYGYSREWPKPLFVEDNGRLALLNVPVPHPDRDAEQGSTLGSIWSLQGIRGRLAAKSETYKLCKQIVKSRPWLDRLAVKARVAHPRHSWEPDLKEITHAWHMTRLLFREIRSQSDKRGAKLIAFYIPPQRTVYEEPCAVSTRETDSTQVARKFLEICEAEVIACIEPTRRFVESARQMKKAGARLYFERDVHWNRYGHQLAAEILAEYIGEQRDLPSFSK